MLAEQKRFDRGRRHTTNTGNANVSSYDHEVLEVSRVVRVVKGGRRFRFRASVIVGDRHGTVGFGIGKSKDVQHAIQKAQKQAEKNTIRVELHDGTISFPVIAKYKGAVVMLKPTRRGTGLIAGGTVRMVANLAGISDLVSKRFGSSNKISNAVATLKALQMASKGLAEKPKVILSAEL